MSNKIQREATVNTPSILFDFENHDFVISGESFPEDVNYFYDPILVPFAEYIDAAEGLEIRFEVRLIYFNSTTSRILLDFIERLDDAAKRDNQVKIVWAHAKDDDNMEEFGEEFEEDIEAAEFELAPY